MAIAGTTGITTADIHNGDKLLIAAGIIGGAFLLGSLLTQPRYYAPPAYYAPQPAYVPSCYQDQVWRRLPDGRIQTGVRTRCYCLSARALSRCLRSIPEVRERTTRRSFG